MAVREEKFKIDISKIGELGIAVARRYKKIAEEHLLYYYKTMEVFSNPVARIKCHDTVYFEEILPIVNNIIAEHESRKSTGLQ